MGTDSWWVSQGKNSNGNDDILHRKRAADKIIKF